jgi:endonuclease III
VARISASKRFKAIFPLLEKAYGRREPFTERPPLEQVLVTLLLKDGKERPALRAIRKLQREFVDLNEARIASPDHIDDLLGRGYPAGVGRQVTRALTAIFNEAQAMNLDAILKLDAKEAEAKFRRMNDLPSRVAGELLMANFGMKQLPAGAGLLRVAQRAGLMRPGKLDSMTRSIRRTVPSALNQRVFHCLETHAERVCTVKDYDCPNCPISEHCETGQKALAELAEQEAREKEALAAEAKRLKEKLAQQRKERARRRAATERLKKQIQDRSSQLNLGAKDRKRRSRKKQVPESTQMVQASSREVKPDEKERSRRKKKRSRKRKKSRS